MSEQYVDESVADARGGDTRDWWHPRSVLTPSACAVAAFAIALLTLSGQNLLLIGVQALFGEGFWTGNDVAGYYLVWGLAALGPLAVVALLARVALPGAAATWEAHLARAAVIVAAVAAIGAVLTAIGGLLHGSIR
jgi:hypothetical protein